nr:Peptidase C1A domain containing protein [Haemonchus contortus]
MKYLVITLCAYLCTASGTGVNDAQEVSLEAQTLSGEPLVAYLRKNQDLFEVTSDPTPNFEERIMNIKFANEKLNYEVKDDLEPELDIPSNYDPRIIWANCTTFYIRDQANCASNWAVSTAAAISDRICIATKAKIQVNVSATDILACCPTPKCGEGCGGGWSTRAWEYFIDEGVVSGGEYLTKGVCRPYPIHPCGHHGNDTYYGECTGQAPTPLCTKKCQPGHRKQYRIEKRYGKDSYFVKESVKAIQNEILKNGPVVASFLVYEDFSHYKSGIYRHIAGRRRGYHTVKMIGWGNENGTDYWLIANSWHNDWGEKGYFRMIRGINHCGIEGVVNAGHVDIESL